MRGSPPHPKKKNTFAPLWHFHPKFKYCSYLKIKHLNLTVVNYSKTPKKKEAFCMTGTSACLHMCSMCVHTLCLQGSRGEGVCVWGGAGGSSCTAKSTMKSNYPTNLDFSDCLFLQCSNFRGQRPAQEQRLKIYRAFSKRHPPPPGASSSSPQNAQSRSVSSPKATSRAINSVRRTSTPALLMQQKPRSAPDKIYSTSLNIIIISLFRIM